MPKVRRTKKSPPEGWELIAPTIDELDKKMRDGKLSCLFVFPNPAAIVLIIFN